MQYSTCPRCGEPLTVVNLRERLVKLRCLHCECYERIETTTAKFEHHYLLETYRSRQAK